MPGETVMVVDADNATREKAFALLTGAGYEVLPFGEADWAIAALTEQQPPAVVLFAVDKDGDASELYRRLHAAAPAPKYIALSEATGVGTAANDLGVVALRKPLDERTFLGVVRGAIGGTLVDVAGGEVEQTNR